MINKCVCNVGIALVALAALATVTPAHAQFKTVAFGGFNCGANILAGEHNASASMAQPNIILASAQVTAKPAGSDSDTTSSALVSAQRKAANTPDPVPVPQYASIGVIGAALLCGWLWKKPEKRTL